jgi:hypothetical protein
MYRTGASVHRIALFSMSWQPLEPKDNYHADNNLGALTADFPNRSHGLAQLHPLLQQAGRQCHIVAAFGVFQLMPRLSNW